MTTRPHDALFKSGFEAPEDAAALLRDLLPRELSEAIAWETMAREPGSFVDAALADRHSDLLFSARLRSGGPEIVYFLLEHQSTGDPSMPLRMLAYQVRIWDRFLRESPGAMLPPILALLVSHAQDGWTLARSLDDMLAPNARAIPGLAPLVPRFSMFIEDLAHLSDDALAARSIGAFQKLALWLLRDARDPPRLLSSFDTWAPTLAGLQHTRAGRDAFTKLVTYMFRVVDPVYMDELRAKLLLLGPRARRAAMTIAEYLHEKGRISSLRSLLVFKFQSLDTRYEARLEAATPEEIDRYLQRVLTADSAAAVFEE